MNRIEIIRNRITEERKKRGWKLADLARKTGIDKATMSNLFLKNRFHEDHLIKFANAFDIPIYKLFINL